MSTFYDFVPLPAAPSQFNFTLDGKSYLAVINWNIYGERWYMSLYDSAGTRIMTVPLTGSYVGKPLSLTAGYFTSQVIYWIENNQIEVV